MKKLIIFLLLISSVSFGQSLYNKWIPASGTDTYSTNITGLTAYTNSVVYIKFPNTNTTTSTLNINTMGAIPIRKWSGSSWVVLSGSELDVNTIYKLTYSGSFFQLEVFSASGGGSWGSITGTLSDQTDLQSALDAKSAKASNLSDLTSASTARTNLGLGTLATQNGTFSGTSSGTNTGDQTTITGNAGTATALQTPRTIGIVTGDATSPGSLFDGSANNTNALTLATVNSNIGTFGSATQVAQIVTNAKGLTTSVTNVTITPAASSITGGAALTKTDDTNVTLTLGGSPTTALLAATSATLGWTGTLAYARFVNGAGLSVVGRSTNSSGVQADITGTANQVLRVNSGGTALAFGAIDVSTASVTGTLQPGNGGTGITSLGTGVATWLGTPSWTNFNAAITGTAPYWGLSSGGTLTGANTITGTSSNTIKYSFASLGTTQTDGAGLYLQNPTAAAAGAQQVSPSLTLEGQGWKTNATAASQSTSFVLDVLPVQGAAAPTSTFRLIPKLAGTAQSGFFQMNSDGGKIVIQNAGIQIQTQATGVGGISLNGSSPSSNTITMTPGGFSISTAGAWSSSGTGITLNPSSSINATSGNQDGLGISGAYIPTSGSGTFSALSLFGSVNQTGGANGNITGINVKPVLTAVGGNMTGISYNPTITSVTGTHYSFTSAPTAAFGGVGTTAPVSTWEINGSSGAKGTSITTNTTLGTTYKYVAVDATGGNVTITLPTAAGATSREYVIWKSDSSGNTVTISTVNGGSKVINAQYGGYSVWDNGTVWYVTGAF